MARKYPHDSIIYIDANAYLTLYSVVHDKKLLDHLKSVKDNIFVTVQIRNEVERRKLDLAKNLLFQEQEKLALDRVRCSITLTDHVVSLLGMSEADTKRINEGITHLKSLITSVHNESDKLYADFKMSSGISPISWTR